MTRLALALMLAATTSTAQQPTCGPRARMTAALAEQFGETQQTMGSVSPGVTAVMETWANDDTGTWTILLSKPDGSACILASGADWLGDAAPLGPPGERT